MATYAYKLLRVRNDGSLGPLFINRCQNIPIGVWLDAEDHPTKGYKHRPGWHCTLKPYAPHLSLRGRCWYKVAIENGVKYDRPESQGGKWLLATRMRVIKPIKTNE
jgi:hypothetical protein